MSSLKDRTSPRAPSHHSTLTATFDSCLTEEICRRSIDVAPNVSASEASASFVLHRATINTRDVVLVDRNVRNYPAHKKLTVGLAQLDAKYKREYWIEARVLSWIWSARDDGGYAQIRVLIAKPEEPELLAKELYAYVSPPFDVTVRGCIQSRKPLVCKLFKFARIDEPYELSLY